MAFPLTPLCVEVIATGNELLDGTIVDSNSKRLAEMLRPLGIKIRRIQIVSDQSAEIQKAVVEASLRADVLVISGGLGPTSDDITLESAAEAFGSKLVEDEAAKKNVLDRLSLLKRVEVRDGHRKQFLIPEGSRAVSNLAGTAPGVIWQRGSKTLFFLAGVPREYNFVLENHLRPFFEKFQAEQGEYLFILKVFGWPESDLNELIKRSKIPDSIAIGFRTHLPENHIKLQVRANSKANADALVAPIIEVLRAELKENLFALNEESFEESTLRFLKSKNWTLSLAESCTGGLASSLITQVSGSSQFFDRGFVTYSNQAKQDLLGVKAETLSQYGAVSEPTVREMVAGALARSKSSVAAAITGIAGPSGGTPEKPVGTVWIAAASAQKTLVKRLQLPFDRELNQKYSAYEALWLLRALSS